MTILSMLAAVALAIRSIAPLHPATHLDEKQTLCLAEAIYHEARGEPHEGQILVAQTIVNRAERSHAGDICAALAVKGQFPWWRNRRNMPVTEIEAFTKATTLAVETQVGEHPAPRFAVFYFFGNTEWRYFRWADTRVRIKVGSHIFLPLQASNDKF